MSEFYILLTPSVSRFFLPNGKSWVFVLLKKAKLFFKTVKENKNYKRFTKKFAFFIKYTTVLYNLLIFLTLLDLLSIFLFNKNCTKIKFLAFLNPILQRMLLQARQTTTKKLRKTKSNLLFLTNRPTQMIKEFRTMIHFMTSLCYYKIQNVFYHSRIIDFDYELRSILKIFWTLENQKSA